MTFALVASVGYTTANVGGGTSSSIDTTGADILLAAVADDGGSRAVLTDSKSNTWVLVTGNPYNSNSQYFVSLYYAKNAIVGSGHTFTTNRNSTLGIVALSGSDLTAPEDNQHGFGDVFITSIQPGSITPSVDNCLVFGAASDGDATGTITGLTKVLDVDGANEPSLLVGYTIQTTAAAINPTFAVGSTILFVSAQCAFKASAGGVVTDYNPLSKWQMPTPNFGSAFGVARGGQFGMMSARHMDRPPPFVPGQHHPLTVAPITTPRTVGTIAQVSSYAPYVIEQVAPAALTSVTLNHDVTVNPGELLLISGVFVGSAAVAQSVTWSEDTAYWPATGAVLRMFQNLLVGTIGYTEIALTGNNHYGVTGFWYYYHPTGSSGPITFRPKATFSSPLVQPSASSTRRHQGLVGVMHAVVLSGAEPPGRETSLGWTSTNGSTLAAGWGFAFGKSTTNALHKPGAWIWGAFHDVTNTATVPLLVDGNTELMWYRRAGTGSDNGTMGVVRQVAATTGDRDNLLPAQVATSNAQVVYIAINPVAGVGAPPPRQLTPRHIDPASRTGPRNIRILGERAQVTDTLNSVAHSQRVSSTLITDRLGKSEGLAVSSYSPAGPTPIPPGKTTGRVDWMTVPPDTLVVLFCAMETYPTASATADDAVTSITNDGTALLTWARATGPGGTTPAKVGSGVGQWGTASVWWAYNPSANGYAFIQPILTLGIVATQGLTVGGVVTPVIFENAEPSLAATGIATWMTGNAQNGDPTTYGGSSWLWAVGMGVTPLTAISQTPAADAESYFTSDPRGFTFGRSSAWWVYRNNRLTNPPGAGGSHTTGRLNWATAGNSQGFEIVVVEIQQRKVGPPKRWVAPSLPGAWNRHPAARIRPFVPGAVVQTALTNLYSRQSGAFVRSVAVKVRSGGVWVSATAVRVRAGGVWVVI